MSPKATIDPHRIWLRCSYLYLPAQSICIHHIVSSNQIWYTLRQVVKNTPRTWRSYRSYWFSTYKPDLRVYELALWICTKTDTSKLFALDIARDSKPISERECFRSHASRELTRLTTMTERWNERRWMNSKTERWIQSRRINCLPDQRRWVGCYFSWCGEPLC